MSGMGRVLVLFIHVIWGTDASNLVYVCVGARVYVPMGERV